MKILATSDLHGNLKDLNFEKIDIAIFAGDFAELKGGGKWHWYDQKKWIMKKLMPMIENNPQTQFCIVPGNHDMIMDKNMTNLYPDINFEIKWSKNVHILIDKLVEINGLKIYGTPWIPIINFRWAFESDNKKLKEKFNLIPKDVDILITHTPPHISNDCMIDRSIQWGGYEAFGSSELAEAIFEKEPKYAFCGHIHSGTHECVEFNKTKIYNVSRVDERYEIAYEPTIIEL
jgi:Icc-related predicted phosphoesterase